MYKVKILSIGKCKEEWLSSALADYARRLGSILSIEWILAKDDAALTALVRKEASYIILDIQGKCLDSLHFAKWLKKALVDGGARLSFVIGGAEGLAKEVREGAHDAISLSPLTFTHQLARLILLEQLYRALEIDRGSPYHK